MTLAEGTNRWTRVGHAEISTAAKCFVSSNKALDGAGHYISSGGTAYRCYFLMGVCSFLPHLSSLCCVYATASWK